jgi:hypothetical protein
MSLEKRFVYGEVFIGDDRLARVELYHPVDQQEGVAMGQVFPNFDNVHH